MAVLATAVPLCLPGCRDTDASGTPIVRDSAGITIVENTAPTWTEGEAWRVSEQPLVTIGQAEAPEPYRFFDIRGAVRLSGGEIVVADFTTNQIRWYDAAGTFLHAVGRKGGGPGEFNGILGMWHVRGDSVIVFDYGNARMTVLGPHGELGRVYRPDQARAFTRPAGPFSDGSFLARSHWWGDEAETTEGIHRGTVLFVRWGQAGEIVDTLAERPVTPQLAEEWRSQARETFGALPPVFRDWRVNLPLPATLPPHGRFVVDAEGNLWVAGYSVDQQPTTWSVFDPTGRLLGTVEVPPGGTATQIGSDFILGVWTDELDVEQVWLYRVTKTAGP